MNETDNIARGNHVVPTEWAQQLERERDEAREEVSSIRNMLSRNGEAVGNGEHNFSIIEMVENLLQSKDYFVRKSDSLERERDEAREELHDIRLNLGEDADGYTLLHAVCVLQNKRDEARAVSD